MDEDLWDRILGLGSDTWKGCERIELLVVQTRVNGPGKTFTISREQGLQKYL